MVLIRCLKSAAKACNLYQWPVSILMLFFDLRVNESKKRSNLARALIFAWQSLLAQYYFCHRL